MSILDEIMQYRSSTLNSVIITPGLYELTLDELYSLNLDDLYDMPLGSTESYCQNPQLLVGNGYNPVTFVELYGGQLIPIFNYPPDPQTHRELYYYNSRENMLYKRMTTGTDPVFAYWRPATA